MKQAQTILSGGEADIVAIVPAAGVGKRMQADCPKQYLALHGKAVLEHTLERLLDHPRIDKVLVALSPDDEYFDDLILSRDPRVQRVPGGKERADSVLSALQHCQSEQWALVHDAARPCITQSDLDQLIAFADQHQQGVMLGSLVRDTMKRTDAQGNVIATVERELLWHALTPQLFPVSQLRPNLAAALAAGVAVTDEASAMEWAGSPPRLIPGRADNLKITRPEDMALAALYLGQQSKQDEE